MTLTQNQKIYKKLLYYFENKIPIYFKLNNVFNQNGEPLFRVGLILDLSEDKSTLVIKENVLGELPFLFEEIDYYSINPARARK